MHLWLILQCACELSRTLRLGGLCHVKCWWRCQYFIQFLLFWLLLLKKSLVFGQRRYLKYSSCLTLLIQWAWWFLHDNIRNYFEDSLNILILDSFLLIVRLAKLILNVISCCCAMKAASSRLAWRWLSWWIIKYKTWILCWRGYCAGLIRMMINMRGWAPSIITTLIRSIQSRNDWIGSIALDASTGIEHYMIICIIQPSISSTKLMMR